MQKDLYIDDLAEETAYLFAYWAENGIDMPFAIKTYMESDMRRQMDKRHAYQVTLTMKEQADKFEFKNTNSNYSITLCEWLGYFYTYIQPKINLESKEVIRRLPFNIMYKKARTLHDIDIDLVTDKIAKSMIDTNNIICFHNPDEPNGYLSNWYHSKFIIDGVTFDSSEQFIMYMKAITFNDFEIANKIMSTTDFSEIKSLGRMVKGFTDNTWDRIKEETMFRGLLQKFSQNEDLRKMLLATNNALLAECAVKDKIWGIGISMKDKNRFDKNKWKGQNLLGKALMRVRDTLKTK